MTPRGRLAAGALRCRPLGIGIVAALAATTCAHGTPWPASPSKILLVSIDTTRADHLGCYGYGRDTSPAIDHLAERGVRFVRAYATMPTTDPSHASMLTGLYPRSHGIMRNAGVRADPEALTLASWLAARGYATAAITARLGLDPSLRGLGGFEHSDAPRLPSKSRDAAEIVALARHWLGARDGGKWFLWVHLWEPHKPYEPSEAYRARFLDGSAAPLATDPPRFLEPGVRLDDELVAASRSLYDAEIARADAAVAAIVAAAELAAPQREPMLLAIVSDHGETLGERQAARRIGFGHGALLYEEVVRVPWILAWEGNLRPQVVDTPVSLVDLAPTIADLVERGADLGADGRSLAADLTAAREPAPLPIVVERRLFSSDPLPELRYAETAWIDYPWKLIVNDGPRADELFRLDSDPDEARNLAVEAPRRRRALGDALAEWRHRHPLRGAPAPRSRVRQAELDALRELGYID